MSLKKSVDKLKAFQEKNNKQQQEQLLVIGDVMLDEYHWCDVSRISPEAPVPVCQVTKTTLAPGGAANVSHNMNALGMTTSLCGFIGKDSSGDKLFKLLQKEGIGCDYLLKAESVPTILKSRIIARHQHVARVDREDAQSISEDMLASLKSHIQKSLETTKVMILSDYLKGVLSTESTRQFIQIASKNGIPVVVDPKGDDYAKYQGATLITPNFSEFQQAIKRPINTEEEVYQYGKELKKSLDLEALLITRSEKGMTLIDQQDKKHDIKTVSKDVYDITGAGDTVVAVMSACIAAGLSLLDAAKLANFAAGIVVSKVGTATTTLSEMSDRL